jgi:hypothetical protein
VPKHHAVKRYRGVQLQLHVFLTSTVDGGKWSGSSSDRYKLGKKLPEPTELKTV